MKELKVGDNVTNGIYNGVITVIGSYYCIIKHKGGVSKVKVKDLQLIDL